jgi:hypothetical protein
MDLLIQYDKLKMDSNNLKDEKCKNLSYRNKNLVDYLLFNFDMNVLKIKDKNIEMCFKIRDDLILSLANFLIPNMD